MSERLCCCVPFCRRTRKPYGPSEWICGAHWTAVPKRMRLVHFRVARRYRRRFGDNPPWAYKGGSPERLESWRLIHTSERLWKRIKREAIERAAGI